MLIDPPPREVREDGSGADVETVLPVPIPLPTIADGSGYRQVLLRDLFVLLARLVLRGSVSLPLLARSWQRDRPGRCQ